MGAFVTRLQATDQDSGTNAGLVYSIIGTDSDFQIDSTSGIVSVRRSDRLDFEVTGVIPVQIRVQDTGTPPLSSQTLVSSPWLQYKRGISTTPVGPVFTGPLLLSHLRNTTHLNHPFLQNSHYGHGHPKISTHKNTGPLKILWIHPCKIKLKAAVMRAIIMQEDIDSTPHKISILSTLLLAIIRATFFIHKITIGCFLFRLFDSFFTQLLVSLSDVNDNAPQFSSVIFPISIEENRIPGSTLTMVTATDADQGHNAALSYRIIGGDLLGELILLESDALAIGIVEMTVGSFCPIIISNCPES